MRNNQTISIKVDDAIALCHIVEEFEEFNKRLIHLLNSEKSVIATTLHKLSQITREEKCLASQSLRKYYFNNKSVIDTISKYSNVLDFVMANYTFGHNIEFTKNNFYQYILIHKDQIDKVLATLERLKELGFTVFKFNPELKFTNQVYSIITSIYMNREILYLENLEAIPSYETNKIKYKTSGSSYEIRSFFILKGVSDEIFNEIVLNDLTIDPERLPQNLNIEENFSKILLSTQEKAQEYSIIRNSIDLSVGIEDLKLIYNEVNNSFIKLEGVDSKPELLEELRKIKEALDQMTILSQQYDKQMISSKEEITEKILTDEKNSYVLRRSETK